MGSSSRTLAETLRNWGDFYTRPYEDTKPKGTYQTPDDDPLLDKDFTLSEFLDVIYSLKRHKAPGHDNITSEDIINLLPNDSEEDEAYPQRKTDSLLFIFKIFSDFWFNENVPHDLKRTILRPFIKDQEKSAQDPSNYRPISLINILMKIYEALIHKRLATYLEKNGIFSDFQAACRPNRSSADHILTLHEIFLEYRYSKFGPRGGRSKKRLFLCFLDLKRLLIRYAANYCSQNYLVQGSEAKCLESSKICSLQISRKSLLINSFPPNYS